MKKKIILSMIAALTLMSSCNREIMNAPRESQLDKEISENTKNSTEFLQKAGFMDAFLKSKEKGDWRVLHEFYQDANKNVLINANKHFDKLRQVCVQEIVLAGLCKEQGKNELLWQEYYFNEMMKCNYQPSKVAYMLLTTLKERWGKEKVHTYAQTIYTKNEKSYLNNAKRASEKNGMEANIAREIEAYVEKLKEL